MKLDNVIATRKHKTVYRDGDRCIKVFDADYSKADVLNEALNQARIEGTGLSIPKILEVTMVEGKWAIVSEFIEGKTLAQMIEESPERKDEYLSLLVDVQLSVHEKTCAHLNKLKDKMNGKISQSSLDATTRYELHTRLEGMPKHKKVCHGDFNPSNVIITEDGTPYIIDWSHATQGNASADAARTYLLFWPLITTNCAVLGSALVNIQNGFNFIVSVCYGFAAAIGFALAIVVFAGVRARMEFSEPPRAFKGFPLTLIAAGLLAMAFSGFSFRMQFLSGIDLSFIVIP